VILRESFGVGVQLTAPTATTMATWGRPAGGGAPRAAFTNTSISGFWLEFPGSKSEVWSSTDVGGNWIFCGSTNPFETLPSPYQPDDLNGCAIATWSDGVITTADLTVPFRGAATKYTMSAELFPAFLPGSYEGFGLTASNVSNLSLPTSGQVWVRLMQVDPAVFGTSGHYDVMFGNTVLASGDVALDSWNPVQITVDPVAQTFNVVIDGVDVGTWAGKVAPSFIAFEGQGVADDLVVQTVP
jgi:hypothetical protein